MSRGLHPRECHALDMMDAGEPVVIVAQLCHLTVETCRMLARTHASRAARYDDLQAALTGRAMFDDKIASGAWWEQ